MTSIRSLFWLLILVAAFPSLASAQRASSEPASLALQVRYYSPQAPAYQPVSSKRGGAWYARFGHVSGWKQPPDSAEITAVNIGAELAEDGVRVWVSVFLGKTHAEEKPVKSYILHEGEKVTVSELTQVGVEPFEIKLVRLPSLIGESPTFASKAKSIEVVSMQPNLSTLPSYKVVIRNLSARNVSALRWQTLQGGRPHVSSMPQGKEGAPLIAPGGTLEFDARLATRTTQTADGYSPELLPNQIIEISTAVLDDGSFEGDSDFAIAFAGFRKGRKVMLGKVLGLLQTSSSANDLTIGSNLDWLKSEVAALKLEADSASVQDLQSKLANLPGSDPNRLKHAIEVGMKGVRDQVLSDITQFQLRNRYTDAKPIHGWLAASKERYEAWFGRL